MLFALKGVFFHQGVRSQKRANPLAERARSVSVNNPDTPFVSQRGIIQKFVQSVRGFFDGHAYYIDFVGSDGFAGSRRYGEIGSGRGKPRPYGTASGYRRYGLDAGNFIQRHFHPQRPSFNFRGRSINPPQYHWLAETAHANLRAGF